MKTRRSQRRTALAPAPAAVVVTEEKAESTAAIPDAAAAATTDSGRRSRRAAAVVAAAAVTEQAQSSFRAPPRSAAAMAAASNTKTAVTDTSETPPASTAKNDNGGAARTSSLRKVTRATAAATTGTADATAADVTTAATTTAASDSAPAAAAVGRKGYRFRKELEDYLPPGDAWDRSAPAVDTSLHKKEEKVSVNGHSSRLKDRKKKEIHDNDAMDVEQAESGKDESKQEKPQTADAKKPKRRSPRIQTVEAEGKATTAQGKDTRQSLGSNAVSKNTKGDDRAQHQGRAAAAAAAAATRLKSSKPEANGEEHGINDDEEEGDADVPMKEIHTLTTVKNHLESSYEPKTKLTDDEIVAFMLRMNRQTHQQAEHQKILVGDMGASQASEIYEDILAEEEEHALGREFYHEMISQMHERQSRRATNLDKRTLGWIRKATGLHRGTPGDAARENSTNTAAPSTARRYTRGMAQHTRKARVEKGLSSLTAAANQIDKEFGPFIVKKPTPPLKRPRAFFPDDDDVGRHNKRHKDAKETDDYRHLSKKERRTLKRHERKRMEAERVLAELRDQNEDAGNGRSTSGPRYGEGGAIGAASKQSAVTDLEFAAPLRMHDWLRRDRIMVEGKNGSKEASKGKDAKDDVVRLPSSYKKLGITHQIPQWTKVSPRVASDRIQAHYPPRRRHDDSVYASLCDKLMKQLAGKARSRIRYEFFYSDLDRQW
jgi:hypothetical protein